MTIPSVTVARRPLELLVSVRSLAEAELAVAAPVDILDFKEPAAGPLAPVASELWEAAAARWGDQSSPRTIAISAALGEGAEAVAIATRVPPQFAFAKAGPSGCGSTDELRRLWDQVRSELPDSVQLVAVTYADHLNAQCPTPAEVVQCACESGFSRVLIDTFTKDGRSSLAHLGVDGLVSLRELTRGADTKLMLAGSIRQRELATWLDAETCPDGIGLRGDLCRAGRTSDLDPRRITAWRSELDLIRQRLN